MLFFLCSTEKLVDLIGRKTTQHFFLCYSSCLWLVLVFICLCKNPLWGIFESYNRIYHYNSNRTYTYKSEYPLEGRPNCMQSFPSYIAMHICGLSLIVHKWLRIFLVKAYANMHLNTIFGSIILISIRRVFGTDKNQAPC